MGLQKVPNSWSCGENMMNYYVKHLILNSVWHINTMYMLATLGKEFETGPRDYWYPSTECWDYKEYLIL